MRELFWQPSVGHRPLIAVIVALMTAWVLVVAIPSPADADEQAKKLATLTGDHQKQQFVAGERVEISKANVADDIYAGGQDVIFETVSAKHIIAMGMSLSLKGITADELFLVGGQMDLSGDVKDDVIAAVCPFCPFGGRLTLTKTMQIADDARLAGRDVTVDGRVGGDLYVAARQFKLTGEIVGNARIEAERIVLASGSRIGGDLLYTGPIKPDVPEGAVITGQIRQVGTDLPFATGVPKNWIWYGVLAVLGVLLALVLLGAALQFAVPALLSSAAATAVERPWGSLGRGLAVAILVPAIVALLMATIVGVPIGIVTMAAFVVLLALAFVSIAYCIGRYVRTLSGKQDVPVGYGSRTLWTAAGILILVIVGLIPFVGWALVVLAMIAGLGAVISQLGPVFWRPDTAAAPA